MTTWPADADGDVLRRLEADDFDFDAEHAVDFFVEFSDWPPPTRAIEILNARFEKVEIVEATRDEPGYVVVISRSRVTHCFVVDMQESLSVLMESYGGVCNAWGVLNG